MSASSPPPADAAPASGAREAAAAAAAAGEAAPVVFYCYECEATVSLPAPAATPSRLLLCPRCRSDFLEENPNPSTSSPPPPPPPPPGFLSDSSSEEPDDLDLGMDHTAARAYLSRLVRRLYDDPTTVATAAAAAVSVLQQQGHRGVGQGQPPATAASIAAVPTVEVSEPAAVCAICKDDLPLAAAARRLPCGHLYHSVCIVQWLEMHNSCPVCRSCLPSADLEEVEPSELDPQPTRITIRFTTNRRGARGNSDAVAPVATSPTQLAQAMTGEGGAGPANSAETVSSEWPPPPESDAVMSEARDAVMSEARDGEGFFD